MDFTINNAREQIKALVLSALKSQFPNLDANEDFAIEVPADRAHGDFSTNAAMLNAKSFHMSPRVIAQKMVDDFNLNDTYFEKVEIAGPGFINFFFSDKFFSDVLLCINEQKDDFGKSDFGHGQKVNVEFVSANPTGPMHMGNARGGALGDCLASVLSTAGFDVKREFYINDAGNQIDKFALSLDIRYRQICSNSNLPELPEDSYHGEDIKQNAQEYFDKFGDVLLEKSEEERKKALVDFALPKNIENMKSAMAKYRIDYDTWFSEKTMHENGEIDDVITLLTKNGYTYEKDGALWYKNIEVQTNLLKKEGKSDEYIEKLGLKDDVLIRANGNPTYFAADIAYHRNKLEKRGFYKAIDIWGADHHGHVARMKGAMSAIGIDPDRLDIVLMQFVRLISNGEVVRMSKRTGKAISLVDLLDEVPIDAVRFMFNTKEAGSLMDFDLDLAVEESSKNPVYYCQYAHARICSILRKLEGDGIDAESIKVSSFSKLKSPEERELIMQLAILPDVIISSAKKYDPAKITHYVFELSSLFHKFYNSKRVMCDDLETQNERICLIKCVRQVIKNVLVMLKINAPEKM